MAVQHIPDEWRGVGSVPTPGVDGMGLNGMPHPWRPEAIWRRNLALRVRAKRQPPCNDGRREGAHVNLAIHVHIDGEKMNDHPPQFCGRRPACHFAHGYQFRILGAATTYIFRALTGSVLSRQHSLLPGLLGGIFLLIESCGRVRRWVRTSTQPNPYITQKEKGVKPLRPNSLYLLVPRPGFEPGTHGFSVRCSTN